MSFMTFYTDQSQKHRVWAHCREQIRNIGEICCVYACACLIEREIERETERERDTMKK